MPPRIHSSLSARVGAGAIALLCTFLLGACTTTQERKDPARGMVANPLAVLFGGPLGCLLECSVRKGSQSVVPDPD